MQYHSAVVGAEMEIQAMQVTATQMQWSMNKTLEVQSKFAV